MQILFKSLKLILYVVSVGMVTSTLAIIPGEKLYLEFLEAIKMMNMVFQIIYYLLALFVMYGVFKSEKTIVFKVLITICILFIFPPISMIILLLMDNEIFSTYIK